MKTFDIIVAMDQKQGIGKNGKLPWHIGADLKRFKEITTRTHIEGRRNAVLMGRRTWESLPEEFRPLPQRINMVLSRQQALKLPENVLKIESFDAAMALINKPPFTQTVAHVFVIGGAEVFSLALVHPSCHRLFITHIEKDFACDTFFPSFPPHMKQLKQSPMSQEGDLRYYFAEYVLEK